MGSQGYFLMEKSDKNLIRIEVKSQSIEGNLETVYNTQSLNLKSFEILEDIVIFLNEGALVIIDVVYCNPG